MSIRAALGALLLGLTVGCGPNPPPPTPVPSAVAGPSPLASPSPTVTPHPSPSPSPTPIALPSTVAFERGGQIWLAGLDGTNARLVAAGGDCTDPRWSPDGRRLLFACGLGTAAELYVADGQGGPPRRLTSNARPERGAVWSPRGDRVAYSLPRALGPRGAPDPGQPEEILVVEVPSASERKVADGFDPAWSPDGARLAYATNGERGPAGATNNAIHVVGADGRGDRAVLSVGQVPEDLEAGFRLPFRPATIRLRAPAWSPDGRLLVASADGHTSMAVSLDERGQGLRVWTPLYEGSVGRSAWSPRGDSIAVEALPATGVDVVVLIDPRTGQETHIGGVEEGFRAAGPTWSPDGRRVAIVARAIVAPGTPEPPRELRAYAADGASFGVIATGPIGAADWNPAR